GCVIDCGTRIERSVVGVRTVLGRNATVRDSVILGANYYEGDPTRPAKPRGDASPVGIGDDSVLDRVIIDKNCRIGRGVRIVNEKKVQEAEADNYVIRDGIVVVPNAAVIPDGTVI